MDLENMTVGERIEEFAKRKNMSIRKLALSAGIPYTTLYYIVNRKSDRVDSEKVAKIANALGIDHTILFFGKMREKMNADEYQQAAMRTASWKGDKVGTTGNRIRTLRREAGMTQAELAQKLGIPYQSIGKWERGLRSPKYETLKKIAKALEVDVNDLLGDKERERFDDAKLPHGIYSDSLMINGVMGLAGESGECVDMVKKYLFQGHDLDKEHLAKELGDVAWYLAITARAIGYDLSTVLQMNVEKLKKRYPDGFTAEKSINRKAGDI